MVKLDLTLGSAGCRAASLQRKRKGRSILDTLRLYLNQARRFFSDGCQALPCPLAAIADSYRRWRRADDKVAALRRIAMLDLHELAGLTKAELVRRDGRGTAANRPELPQSALERLQQVRRIGLRSKSCRSCARRQQRGGNQPDIGKFHSVRSVVSLSPATRPDLMLFDYRRQIVTMRPIRRCV